MCGMVKKGEVKMLSVREVADRLGAGASSVRLWVKDGKFKDAEMVTSPLGSYWLIPETALEGFEIKGRGRPAKPQPPKEPKKRGRPQKGNS